MPELPEVETIARQLRRCLQGKVIAEVQLSGLALRRPVSPRLPAVLPGRSIRRVLRRGKYLLLELQPRSCWLIHLGMSGRILYNPPPGAVPPHTHLVVRFTDDSRLHYRDQRRFGLLELHESACPGQVPAIRALGPDPLSARFTAHRLQPALQKCRRTIKSFLLDQRRVAGLGNIYACEAMHRARLHPERRCDSLTPEECSRLVRAAREAVRSAVRHRGTSFSDFMVS
ncbi:MAG: bifunctional DNA-formamidopyrimidine glycosylase/DNA-(apurinic or apyrimidinic site) lyase, partial [Acidobacteria bacterium]|nr:bifunctional DNA-formamidopyrimidine glycosylase/DNA-(apurinic or apyrimidinic site) lyase [Acidobacteriota bacterium]